MEERVEHEDSLGYELRPDPQLNPVNADNFLVSLEIRPLESKLHRVEALTKFTMQSSSRVQC